MGLSADEAKLLKRLQRKAEEPDAPPASRSLSISIDLGDEKQVERAHKLGLLSGLFDGDEDENKPDADEDEDADDADEEQPRRRGYFKD